jgi:feruloyl esterase
MCSQVIQEFLSKMRSILLLVALSFAAACATAHEQTHAPLTADTCAALAAFAIPAADIGLPTSGAQVTGAELVAGVAHPTVTSDYCRVSGEIAPVDAAAPNIEFRVALPTRWNGKAVMFGGGGLNGVIPNVEGNPSTVRTASTPLARGYAVFGSDSGHQGDGAEFTRNREAYLNYSGDALKKTRDVAIAVIKRAYAANPHYSYFLGSSKGGQEALTVASRWPTDWDGIVALYPARGGPAAMIGMLAASQALAAPGAWITPESRALLFAAVLEHCDHLDGVRDGVVSNVRGCRAIFDPGSATLNGKPLRCVGGAAPCLSDAQLGALRAIDSPVRSPLIPDGATFPGYPVFTSDLGRPGAYGPPAPRSSPGLGATAPMLPVRQDMMPIYRFAQSYFQYSLGYGPAFNALGQDIAHPDAAMVARVTERARLDIPDTDLTAFAARGGKLILLQGDDDMLISARVTEAYYKEARDRLGDATHNRMLRYYEVPGMGHGASQVFNADWDMLTAIEQWVEHDADPAERLTVRDSTGAPGRTRPLCVYPHWPRYLGGDVNTASSFECAGE